MRECKVIGCTCLHQLLLPAQLCNPTFSNVLSFVMWALLLLFDLDLPRKLLEDNDDLRVIFLIRSTDVVADQFCVK